MKNKFLLTIFSARANFLYIDTFNQTNDINVSILGLCFLDQFLTQRKKSHICFIAFIFLVQYKKQKHQNSQAVFLLFFFLRTVKLYKPRTVSFYNCPSRTLQVSLHCFANDAREFSVICFNACSTEKRISRKLGNHLVAFCDVIGQKYVITISSSIAAYFAG